MFNVIIWRYDEILYSINAIFTKLEVIMVMSHLLRAFLLVALCVPMFSNASQPVAATSDAKDGGSLFSTAFLLKAGVVGASLVLGSTLYNKWFKSNKPKTPNSFKLSQYLTSASSKATRATNYVQHVGLTWKDMFRTLVYRVWDAPANIRASALTQIDTHDRDVQEKVFGGQKDLTKMSLPEAIVAGNMPVVKRWLAYDKDLVIQALIEADGTNDGKTGAMIAAQWGQDKIFELFLTQSNVDQADNHGKTALHWVMTRSQAFDGEDDKTYQARLVHEGKRRANIIQLLVDSWANLHAGDQRDITPLMLLAENVIMKRPCNTFLDAFAKSVDLNPSDINDTIDKAAEKAVIANNLAFVESFIKHFGKSCFPENVQENATDEMRALINPAAHAAQNLNTVYQKSQQQQTQRAATQTAAPAKAASTRNTEQPPRRRVQRREEPQMPPVNAIAQQSRAFEPAPMPTVIHAPTARVFVALPAQPASLPTVQEQPGLEQLRLEGEPQARTQPLAASPAGQRKKQAKGQYSSHGVPPRR